MTGEATAEAVTMALQGTRQSAARLTAMTAAVALAAKGFLARRSFAGILEVVPLLLLLFRLLSQRLLPFFEAIPLSSPLPISFSQRAARPPEQLQQCQFVGFGQENSA
jgi:hypothetical protein